MVVAMPIHFWLTDKFEPETNVFPVQTVIQSEISSSLRVRGEKYKFAESNA